MKTTHGIRTDYKTPASTASRAKPNLHWGLRWTALGIGCAVLGVVMAKSQPAPGLSEPEPLALPDARMQRIVLDLPEAPASQPERQPMAKETIEAPTSDPIARHETLTVQAGDSLAALFGRAGIDAGIVHRLARAGEAGRRLNRVFPGDTFEVGFDAAGAVARVRYELGPERAVVFSRNGDGFESRLVEEPMQRRLAYASGVIDSSLFLAGTGAGLDDALIMELVGIFGWDIDFALDIRRGDRFSLVYEDLFRDGERVRHGDIVAAEFVNQGRVYRAVRYTDSDGETDYFAPDGSSMRKAFLRTPVRFSRVSSGFGKRYHPRLHRMRMHHGVDYAARTGTPIRATGDGRIARRGRHGGYGNTVVIRHGGRYSTLYAHMHRFARGQRVGSHVEQGEVIGYVGSTGLSTGPHLHYEFRVNGVHRNPLKVEFPSSDPIPDDQLARFRDQVKPLLAQLDTLGRFYARLDR